jgi:hypothetical protein
MRDLHHNIGTVTAILPQTITTAGGAVNSGNLDLLGFESAEFVVSVGTSGDTLSGTNKLSVKIEHAPDDDGSPGTYAPVAAVNVLGATPDVNGVVLVVDDPAEDAVTHRFGYVGSGRFLKLTVTPAGTHTNGTPVSAVLVKGNPLKAPVA